jgi:amidase
MTEGDDLCFLPATEQARLIRERAVSAVDLMRAHLERIERVNPAVNAIVTLVPERALAGAQAADEALARGEAPGLLHGLPVAHKDLVATAGIRTTFGSPLYADFVPDADALIVQRLRAAGAITLGKTNTPEFGAGSQTFNAVFGTTLNPYDRTKTCGGSSGGAAVALACGMVPIADGSDLGGSLRNPASFCNVVGLRPAPGRVPSWPSEAPWFPFSVQGPMARTVADAALLLSAMAGPDARVPLARAEPGERFRQPLGRDFRGVRVAWSRDLGGLPVDPRVTAALEEQRPVVADLGCEVVEAEPDTSGADEAFAAWRAWIFELGHGAEYDQHRDQLKATVVWNIEQGRRLTGPALARAERGRAAYYARVLDFMAVHEFLLLPVSQVPPFPADQEFPAAINGEAMGSYIDWMKSCSRITMTGLPAISVPCGFTPEGLPVGLQIVGRPGDEFGVLQFAAAFEAATRTGDRHPRDIGVSELT